jgi:hypothetical protein
MKPAVLCLLLVSACELTAARNFGTYALTWTCLSPESCERAEQVILFDRADIINGDRIVRFSSTRDGYFWERAQMVPSDTLPAECAWLHGFAIFEIEADPSSMFCRVPGGFELELSIPNRDPATRSKWLVEGRELEP